MRQIAVSLGGQRTNNMTYLCYSPGMPRAANGYGDIEFAIAPTTFHILVDHIYDNRRIFTDGRPWPNPLVPTLLGHSIGQWVDTDGHGKYDVLEAETRGFRGPRAYDATGLPLHHDNQSVIKEKFYIDPKDPNISHDEVTVYDHALMRHSARKLHGLVVAASLLSIGPPLFMAPVYGSAQPAARA